MKNIEKKQTKKNRTKNYSLTKNFVKKKQNKI